MNPGHRLLLGLIGIGLAPLLRLRVPNQVLLVEPQVSSRASLRQVMAPLADVNCCAHFPAARRQLLGHRYDFVVANLRLGAYNGLHLVYLAQARRPPPRSIVYTNTRNPVFAREVQGAGAFYAVADELITALPAYVQAVLPERDRRDAAVTDRRHLFRGGRRACDASVVAI